MIYSDVWMCPAICFTKHYFYSKYICHLLLGGFLLQPVLLALSYTFSFNHILVHTYLLFIQLFRHVFTCIKYNHEIPVCCFRNSPRSARSRDHVRTLPNQPRLLTRAPPTGHRDAFTPCHV